MKRIAVITVVAVTILISAPPSQAAVTNLYSTGFEAVEGYSTDQDLAGQNNWQWEGSGGNGVIADGLHGQSAYLGFNPPQPTDSSLVLWQPINFDPMAAGYPLVTFRVLVSISDSPNGEYDIFRWSVYNQQVNRLFSIDLDNWYLDVSYQLDGTNSPVFTDIPFENDRDYLLTVTMNFAANRWSATFDDAVIATNQPITTTSAPLTLGDIDAVWLFNQMAVTNGLGQIEHVNTPGDNFMVFDDYQLAAATLSPSAAQLQMLGYTKEGWSLLRLQGESGHRWAIEATTNFATWTALNTNVVSGGTFDVVDTTSSTEGRRFYRARYVP